MRPFSPQCPLKVLWNLCWSNLPSHASKAFILFNKMIYTKEHYYLLPHVPSGYVTCFVVASINETSSSCLYGHTSPQAARRASGLALQVTVKSDHSSASRAFREAVDLSTHFIVPEAGSKTSPCRRPLNVVTDLNLCISTRFLCGKG